MCAWHAAPTAALRRGENVEARTAMRYDASGCSVHVSACVQPRADPLWRSPRCYPQWCVRRDGTLRDNVGAHVCHCQGWSWLWAPFLKPS